MTLKNQLLLGALALLTAFAAGRFSVKPPRVQETIVKNTEKTSNETKNTHTVTKREIIKEPNGEEKTTEIIDTRSTDKDQSSTDVQTNKEITITPQKTGTLHVSALIGFTAGDPVIRTGISVSKDIIGPVSLGAFYLTNGVLGVSMGLSF